MQKQTTLTQVAGAITLVINHLDVPNDSQFFAAHRNVDELNEQKEELEKQQTERSSDASAEARDKLSSEIDSVTTHIK